jgi:heavy metal sensor kinase
MLDSVRVRLTIWHSAVLGVLLVVFALSAYAFLEHVLEARTDRLLTETAGALAAAISAERATSEPREMVAREALREFRSGDLDIAVYDEKRHVVAASVAPARPTLRVGRGERKLLVRPLAAAAVDTVPASVALPLRDSMPATPRLAALLATAAHRRDAPATVSLADGNSRVYAVPVQHGDESLIVAVMRTLRDQDDLLEEARFALLIAVPLTLLLASGGGYFLARHSLAPVLAMSARAEQIGASNLDERLPVVNSRDELGRLAGVFNQLLARLDGAFAQQRQFMADASHELRTPVAILRGEAEVALAHSGRSEEDYREALTIVREEGTRLTRIVDDLFLLARSDAGHRTVARRELYLDDLVSECVRAVRTLAEGRGLSLHSDLERELPMRGDEGLLRRLLINLLDNAIKYTPSGGSVSVTLSRDPLGTQYVVDVADTGPGIPPHDQARIFERFVRLEHTSAADTPQSSGAGLGLAIARVVAESHDGRLELHRSDGAGSVFRAVLPA